MVAQDEHLGEEDAALLSFGRDSVGLGAARQVKHELVENVGRHLLYVLLQILKQMDHSIFTLNEASSQLSVETKTSVLIDEWITVGVTK